ncbi:MAG: type II toxin-antitoxin system VapC family toxin [bacterium]
MNIVADTNIFLAVALDEPEKKRIIEITSESTAISPDILPYEIGNALTAMLKRRKISKDQALSIFRATQNIPVRLISVDINEALKIAIQFNIYAYDAYFIRCCRSMSCPLITLDKRMKGIAKQLNITVKE